MRTGEKMRRVYIAYLEPNKAEGPCIYIAADDYVQAFGFAVDRNAQGFMRRLAGVIVFSKQAPFEIEVETLKTIS